MLVKEAPSVDSGLYVNPKKTPYILMWFTMLYIYPHKKFEKSLFGVPNNFPGGQRQLSFAAVMLAAVMPQS